MRPLTRCTVILLALAAPMAAQQPALSVVQLREDLDWFRQNVFAVEQSYAPQARSEAQRRLAALEAALPGTSPLAFEMELARVVALADNGHSGVAAMGRARRSNRIPLRLVSLGNEFRVMRASADHADLLGARLDAIDGRAIEAVRDSGHRLFGGTPTWRDRNLPLFLESPDQLKVMGIARDAGSAEYAFTVQDSRRVRRRFVAERPDGAGFMQPDFTLYALPPQEASWRALEPVATPWFLQEPMSAFRWRAAPEIDAIVVQLRRIVDAPGMPIATFLDSMTATIRAQRPRNLVVDVRMNGGGNLQTAREFMKSLPSLVPGRIFVITGPGTFSAAISSVGYLKQAAPDRVTIVGEEVGDRLVFFAEGRPATSPNLRMTIGLATQRHDYQNGCRAFTDCHGPVVANPIAVPTLVPALPAPFTFADWKAGRDPSIEAIARALKGTS